MKRWLPKLVGAFILCGAIYAVVWIASSCGVLGEISFGYYRDFYVAKQAIKRSECVDSIAYSRHEDLTLEDFHFKAHTKSGFWLRLWFDEHQDVSRACDSPEGLIILHPTNWSARNQIYGINIIVEHLKNKGIKRVTLASLLCNLDELIPLFEANYENDSIPRVTTEQQGAAQYSRYLRVEIVDEKLDRGWIETPTW